MKWLNELWSLLRAPDRRRFVGLLGEMWAAAWLRWRGYQVLKRDFETPHAQVDLLIAQRVAYGWRLCLCEVKSRRGEFLEAPLKKGQAERLWRAAQWLERRCAAMASRRMHRPSIAVRVDLLQVEFCGPKWLWCARAKVRHIEGVLWHESGWEEKEGLRY